MPWRDRLNQAKNELNKVMGSSQQQQQLYPPPPPVPPRPEQQYQQQYQQQYLQPYHQQYHQQYQAAPMIPPRPPGWEEADNGIKDRDVPGRVYWQPEFLADVEISREWDAKTGHGTDGWGNQELQCYTDQSKNAFYTLDGRLVLRAVVADNTNDQKYTSARLVSRQTLAQDRGVLTAVVLSPCAEGIWPALWLLPREPFAWPSDGEIDIAETWNGDGENRTCLHWGRHEDQPDRHRVVGTRIPDMRTRPVRYDFVWDQLSGGFHSNGRMIWYIDGRPVMKAAVPDGMRPLRDMTVLLNVAMGGNVCGGKVPAPGAYDMVVLSLAMAHEMERDMGGWGRFERDWSHPSVPEGNTY